MSNFHEMVKADLLGVFLDMAYFGVEATVEGNKIFIAVDNDELKKRQGGQDFAIAESATLFYALTEDLPKRKTPGQNININGRECTIDDWQEDMGISTITVRENIIV